MLKSPEGHVSSQMRIEALQAPECVQTLLHEEQAAITALAHELLATAQAPRMQWLTLGRGSSHYAAQHFSTLLARTTGRLAAPLPLSLATLFQAPLDQHPAWPLAFSQSGQSPDLLAALRTCDPEGRHSAAFVNTPDSLLGRAARHCIAMHAGPELSVAATKSVLCQMTAGAMVVAALAPDNTDLRQELRWLPDWMHRAQQVNAQAAVDALASAQHLYVIARGQGLAVAQELALKFKETCGLQAEAVSCAELQHGPLALATERLHALVLITEDQGAQALLDCAGQLRELGARVCLAAPQPQADWVLPTLPGQYCTSIAALAGLYLLVERVALARGYHPDAPRHLRKVTLTY
jgi:glucosamine--fructose-6-phosphate aminotransferase (isomerizing)